VWRWSLLFSDSEQVMRRAHLAVGPSLPLVTLSRREFTSTASRMMDLAEANVNRPMREANWDEWYEQRRAWRASAASQLKYAPLLKQLPYAESTQARAERLLGGRDALLVVIALELFHREHGQYPRTLDALVPAGLPAIPADRITGVPLHYRLIDGKPTLYSVGLDRDDDGGRPPLTSRGELAPQHAAMWELAPEQYPDGDWVLYPRERDERRHE
jgi:hypothetical protein